MSLVLQGVSGTPEHRFAIINGHTVAVGESAEISTENSRLRFRCIEIKAESCIVEVDHISHQSAKIAAVFASYETKPIFAELPGAGKIGTQRQELFLRAAR